ncbi:integrase [Stackebrandtia albiflava]|uniref:integrase n=1 Tax=Stackebrandtia albiflava TaxID=406432 RepID=UPI0011BD909B|nr:integrase [Stackebrandtia albiflava]
MTGVSTPTRPFKENEDWLGSGPDMVVVLDGCGVGDALAADVDRRCVHGLPWYVKTLGTALLRSGADRATPLPDALATAIADTASAHRGRCDLRHPATPASTVVVLRQNREAVEYLVLSDSVLVVDDGGEEPMVLTDDRLNRLNLTPYGEAAPGSAEFVEISRRRADELARARNRPDGFPIAAADPKAAYRALTGHLGRGRVRRALLATDGATRLVELFGKMTWLGLLNLAETRGPEEVIARTRSVEESDPDSSKWRRGKVHDDATVAFCQF